MNRAFVELLLQVNISYTWMMLSLTWRPSSVVEPWKGDRRPRAVGRRQTPGAGAEEPRPNFGGHSLSQASSTHFDCVSPVAADATEGPTISHSVSVQIAHVFHNCDTPHPGQNRATRSLCWSSLHSVRLTMSLPSSREIELETLLRQRDAQVLELTVRIFHIAYEYRS